MNTLKTMDRKIFLKEAGKVDAIIWPVLVRSGDDYFKIVTSDSRINVDTLEDAIKYCKDNNLSYLEGVY